RVCSVPSAYTTSSSHAACAVSAAGGKAAPLPKRCSTGQFPAEFYKWSNLMCPGKGATVRDRHLPFFPAIQSPKAPNGGGRRARIVETQPGPVLGITGRPRRRGGSRVAASSNHAPGSEQFSSGRGVWSAGSGATRRGDSARQLFHERRSVTAYRSRPDAGHSQADAALGGQVQRQVDGFESAARSARNSDAVAAVSTVAQPCAQPGGP